MPLSEEHRMWNAAPAALYQISTCMFRKMRLLQRSWKPHSWRDRRHLWGPPAFHISTSPLLITTWNHRPPKVWWRKNPLREKLQSGWTPWFIRILDCKSARKSVCFIGFLSGGGQSSLIFPKVSLQNPYSSPEFVMRFSPWDRFWNGYWYPNVPWNL